MNWTDERVALLTKLWAEGLSASQIAAQLGGVSRNAVIGKVHRLKLSGRGKTTKTQPRAPKAASVQANTLANQDKIASVNNIETPSLASRPNVEKSTSRMDTKTSDARSRKSETLAAIRATAQSSHQTEPNKAPSQSPSSEQRSTRPQPNFTASTINVDFTNNEAANFDAQLQDNNKDNNVVPIKRNLTLLQLTETTCKWPIGDPLNEDFHFCGADAGEASPYCSYHSKIAFQPISDRRRMRA